MAVSDLLFSSRLTEETLLCFLNDCVLCAGVLSWLVLLYITPTSRSLSKHAGTIPAADPSKELPDVDQHPPDSVAAGPTPGYSARGGDNRPV